MSEKELKLDIAKLRWQCRRGMLELDIILNQFLTSVFPTLTKKEQQQFQQLLSVDDPTLYAWLMGTEKPSDPDMYAIVSKFLN
jgi:antitoxin CptB